MNQTQPPTHPDSLDRDSQSSAEIRDDISLVDLAKIIVKRWKALLSLFSLLVTMAVFYAFMAPKVYEYTSLYSVAEQAPTESNPRGHLEPPGSLANKAQSVYLTQSAKSLLSEEGEGELPFQTSVSVPGDSLLVMLASEAKVSDIDLVEAVHEETLKRMQADQEVLLERRRQSLMTLLENAQQNLQEHRGSSDGNSDVAFRYVTLIAELEADLAMLENGELIQVAQQGLDPVSMSRSVIIGLGIVLGGILGVLGVFMLEFSSIVRKDLAMEKRRA